MQENILIKALTDFSKPFQDVGRLDAKIDALGNKKVRLTVDINASEVKSEIDNLAAYAQRAFQKTRQGSAKRTGLITGLDKNEVQAEIARINELTGKLRGGAAGGRNFNPAQTGLDIAKGLRAATAQAEIAQKSVSLLRIQLESARSNGVQLAGGFGRAAGAGQKLAAEMVKVQKSIAKAAKEKEKFEGRVQGRIDSGRAINPNDEVAFYKAEADLDRYIKKLAELQRLQQSSGIERIQAKLSGAELELSSANDEVARLNAIQAALEKLTQAYTELGNTGKGIEVTKAGLKGQLAVVNELISNSELYNKNEQERINLFKAQQRILQGTKALTLDLIKANQELYESPARRQFEKGIAPTIRDAFGNDAPDGFQSADDLIQKYSAGTGLREGQLVNTKEGIRAAIAELKKAQENVDIFGDKFRAINFIIEQLEGRLGTSLKTPIIQAGNAADELVQKLKVLQGNGLGIEDRRSKDYRQVESGGGTYRGRGGQDSFAIPEFAEVKRAPGGAIVPYDASFAIAQTRQLITLLDSLGAYTAPSLSLKGLDQVGSAPGLDRQIRVGALDPNAGTGLAGLPRTGREQQFPIVKYDAEIAKQNQAIADSIDLTQRLAQERQKLAKSLSTQKKDRDFAVQAGTIEEIERLSKTAGGIPARIDLIVKAAKDLAPQFREGSEEAQRLLAVIDELSSKKSSPFFDLKSLDSYSGKIAELRRQIGSSDIGSDEFLSASKTLGFTELDQLDRSGASSQEQQAGRRDYFAKLQQEAGSAAAAVQKIFADFGNTPAGIGEAASKLAKIRDSLPISETDRFNSLVNTVARALGLAGEAGLKGFGATESAARKAAEEAQRYNKILGNLRTKTPVTPDDLSFARNRARSDLASAVPGSDKARKALSAINKIDFSEAIGNLRNLEVKGQALNKLDIGTALVGDLERIANGAKEIPGLYDQVKQSILSLKDAFSATGGEPLDAFNNLISTFEKPKQEGPETEAGSLKAYNEAVSKSKELAEKAAVGTLNFSKNIEKLAQNIRVAAAAQREFDKVLSKDSANESAQNLKELQGSGLGLEDFIDKQFEGTPNNRTGAEARIQALKDQFGDLDFDASGLEMFKGEYQQTLANLQQRLDSVSFQNIESDLLDLGQLFKDVFSRGIGGNQPGLLASLRQGGFAGLRQRAAALSPGSRRGLSEAMIGGGFPLLFGQGPLAAGGGLAGGLLGPALLGGGGGFSGSIIGTALGSGLENLSTSATELSKALIDPVANLEQLGDASLIASTGVQGLVKALAGQGKGAEAAAALEAELSKNPTLATVRDQEVFRQNSPLLRGLSNAKATGELQVGNAIKQGLAAASTLVGLVAGGGSAIGNALIPGQKQKNDDRVASFEELGELAKKARDASDSLSILAAGAEGLPSALGERRGILARIAEGGSGAQETRSQLEQERSRAPALRNLEKIAELEQELIQKQKERTIESQKSLASANARLSIAQRELALEQKLSSSSGAGTDALRAFETSRFSNEGAIQAEKLALQDIAKLEQELAALRSTYGYSSDKEKELNASLSGAQEALAIAQEQQAIEKKITLERVNQAKLAVQSSRRDLDFARFTAGLVGADLENAGDDRQLAEARREYGEIAAAVNLAPQSEELRLNLEAAANRLQQAGISMADNIVKAAGESAQRFLTGLQADNSLNDAIFARNAIQKLPPGFAAAAIQGNETKTGAQNQILASGQDLASALTELRAAQERAAAGGGEVSPQFAADVQNAAKGFAETTIRAGNQVAISLRESSANLANASNSAGQAILNPKARDVFGGTQRQLELGAPLIERAFAVNLERFQKAFGQSAYPMGGAPLTLGGKAEASDVISDLVSKIEQVQQSQALITALGDATAGIQNTAANVVEGLNNLAGKNWEVNVLVNGQPQALNLG